MSDGFSAADRVYMTRALELALRGLYTTQPNPRVGCVLVRAGRVVGEGWHRSAGQAHAERIALAHAGAAARGAAAYVTLEPCCHHGRTPPCTDALVEAGVARVLAAQRDPNPQVAGRGIAELQAQGIEACTGLYAEQAAALNPGFIKRMTRGLPHVRCKLAASLDGRTAMASGESRWISSEDARRDVQRLRARSGAVVTGVGTVLADDPALNVRLDYSQLPGVGSAAEVQQPLRVVLDSCLRTPVGARMPALPGETLIIGGADAAPAAAHALRAAGAQVVQLATQDGRLDLTAAFRHLAQRQVNEVLLECGPTLAGAALQAGLVDEIVLYLAPHLMGDAARGLFSLPGLDRMRDRLDVSVSDVRSVGVDLRLTLVPGRQV